jgi:hypothetical protein
MTKPFLLIAGSGYYPESGTGDWVACYETCEEARSQVEFLEFPTYFQSGKRKGEVKSIHTTYKVSGGSYIKNCDWFEIVDLRDWAEVN